MIKIDGSYLEGGGQILRISLFLSLLTKKPFYIYNIRKGRPKPGLKNQHLHIIKAIKKICDVEVEGDYLHSETLKFIPSDVKGGKIKLDFKTAGSIPLFLQTLFPLSFISKSSIYMEIKGGTDVPGAPTMDYFLYHVVPIFSSFLKEFKTDIRKRGYYPVGGGELVMKVDGELKKHFFEFEKGILKGVKIYLSGSELLKSKRVLERIRNTIVQKLERTVKDIQFKLSYQDSSSPGCAVFIKGIFEGKRELGVDVLCKKGVLSEQIGSQVTQKFINLNKRGDSPDPNLADHIVPFLALYGGKVFQPEPTKHFETAIWTCKKFLNFHLEKKESYYVFIPDSSNIL